MQGKLHKRFTWSFQTKTASEKVKLKDDRFEEEHHQKVVAFLYLKSVKTSRSGKIQTPASGFHFPTLHAITLKSQFHPPYPLQRPNIGMVFKFSF